VDLELYSLAASAILGCTYCLTSHEQVTRHGGLSPEQVNDAVRIAATVHGVSLALALEPDAASVAATG
jgi:alkyl hydroperoxide reductase subunit D